MIIENAKQAAEEFNNSMTALFPQFMARAVVGKILGNCLTVEFANVSSREQAANGILLNASGHMKFMMHLSGSRGDYPDGTPVEIELISWNYEAKQAGLKFRKIKGKNPAEAMQKLFKWFEKNADIIRGM